MTANSPSPQAVSLPDWIEAANNTLEAYEADLGETLDDMHELGRIDESRGSASFRIRVGHIRDLASIRLASRASPADGVVVPRLEMKMALADAIWRYDNGEFTASRVAMVKAVDILAAASPALAATSGGGEVWKVPCDHCQRMTVVPSAQPAPAGGGEAFAHRLLSEFCACYGEAWPAKTCQTEASRLADWVRATPPSADADKLLIAREALEPLFDQIDCSAEVLEKYGPEKTIDGLGWVAAGVLESIKTLADQSRQALARLSTTEAGG